MKDCGGLFQEKAISITGMVIKTTVYFQQLSKI